ncbi:hypothetical protein NEMBOFW57_009841 [Staphylotrichum longicolle]|uniref:Uncharacterized protein n=1 Tax=Staphylotrichum longicolle TaxID=669026 RepID=A0AAD4EQ19_9PEZI|nr:hypothetical protein NEMBOFW57_009841 [Staphylotrichum longicolle]
MSAHAQVIPSIAAGIARLKNAQSASLRDKLNALSRGETSGGDSEKTPDSETDDTHKVTKRLWSLCQTRIRPDRNKQHSFRRRVDESTIKQLPSHVVLAAFEETSTEYFNDVINNALVSVDDYELVAEHKPSAVLPEVSVGPHYLSEDEEPPSEEGTHSSEGDYFYTDGQGNVYPIQREGLVEDDTAAWPSTPQLASSELSHGEETLSPLDAPFDDWGD